MGHRLGFNQIDLGIRGTYQFPSIALCLETLLSLKTTVALDPVASVLEINGGLLKLAISPQNDRGLSEFEWIIASCRPT